MIDFDVLILEGVNELCTDITLSLSKLFGQGVASDITLKPSLTVSVVLTEEKSSILGFLGSFLSDTI